MTTQPPYDAAAFGYPPGRGTRPGPQATTRRSEIAHAQELLLLPGSTLAGVDRTLGVSAQTIRRYVLGEPRSR